MALRVTLSETTGRRLWLLGLVALFAVAVVYWPVRHADFNWDDDQHITANPTIIGPLGLKEIWTSGKANYFPLTMTSFWVQHALWGLSPGPYHVVTVAFHAAAALLLWQVLRRLRVPGAWQGATIWALHPVQVESVAWICELKNTQSAVFYLAAVWWFLRWLECDGPSRFDRNYAFSLVAGVLAVLSKSSTVMLPVVLGLIAWWRGHRRWRDALWLTPFFAVSLMASGWTIWEQKVNSMATGPDWDHGLAARLMIAGKVPWFYLGKLLWPEPRIFIYPRWKVDALGFVHWLPLAGTLAVGVLLWVRRQAWPAVFTAFAYFFVTLFPVLGLFDVFFFKYSFVGDHFQYLASMGPLVLLAGGIATAANRWGASAAWITPIMGGTLLLALGGMSRTQARWYVNGETLWRETVRLNPDAWIARMNLGTELMMKGRAQQAVPHYEAALRLKPADAISEANVGSALVQSVRLLEAIPYLENALRRMPNLPDAQNSLGVAHMRLGRWRKAIGYFEETLRLKPTFHLAEANLGECLLAVGKPAEALTHFQAALQLAPGMVVYHGGAARALTVLGRQTEAMEHYQAAQRIQSPDLGTLRAMADLFNQSGHPEAALEHARAALALRPDYAEAHSAMGQALLKLGRVNEAVAHFEQVVRADAENDAARTVLATALFQAGRAAEAVPHYAALARRTPSAPTHNNLASALLESGRVAEAIESYRKAIESAPDFHEARLNLALALEAAGRRDDAVKETEEVLRRQPANPRARGLLEQLIGTSMNARSR